MRPRSLSWIRNEINPDIVTGLQSFQTGFIARKIASFIGVPYVTWEHLSLYERRGALPVSDGNFVDFLEESHAVLVVSASLQESIRKRFSIALKNSHILPNPIPLGFAETPASPLPGWLEEARGTDFVFASWTTWRDVKRIDLLLDAFLVVHQQKAGVKLIIAGALDEKAKEIKERMLRQNPSVASSVIFTGSIDRSSIRHLARAADCCVISSDLETFGLQMVEAIAVGTPVVSTRCGGPEDILGDRRLGVLCARDSVDGLAGAMLKVINTKDDYRPEEIARIADELLGHDAIKRKWSAVYEGVARAAGGTV